MATKTAHATVEREKNANGVDERLALISSQLAVQGEQVRAILEILTADTASDGPSLATQMGELIVRLNNQNCHLKELAVAIGMLGRDLPLNLVAAIDDNLDVSRRNGDGAHRDGDDRV